MDQISWYRCKFSLFHKRTTSPICFLKVNVHFGLSSFAPKVVHFLQITECFLMCMDQCHAKDDVTCTIELWQSFVYSYLILVPFHYLVFISCCGKRDVKINGAKIVPPPHAPPKKKLCFLLVLERPSKFRPSIMWLTQPHPKLALSGTLSARMFASHGDGCS